MLDARTKTKSLFWFGGLACMILILYSIITMLIMTILGTPPVTIEKCFSMLNQHRVNGLLRLDILTVFVMPLYYLLFYCIYQALRKSNQEVVSLSTIIIFAGLTLFLATPSVFSLLHLSDKYALASTEMEKNQLLAAGQAIIASDMWHGTGARIGGILIQSGALLISIIMLKSNVFNKFTAITGIVTHGLDFLHIIIVFFSPVIGVILMAVAGPLYLVWFPLIGVRLFRLNTQNNA